MKAATADDSSHYMLKQETPHSSFVPKHEHTFPQHVTALGAAGNFQNGYGEGGYYQ